MFTLKPEKEEIEEIERHQQKDAVVKSKTKLIENKENPTKFFYKAEKQNQNKKNITRLKNKRHKNRRRRNFKNSKIILFRPI